MDTMDDTLTAWWRFMLYNTMYKSVSTNYMQ